ncbi:hypothetical protein TSAR_001105 [Trichomalopsis sarcophagae]|uniref:Uncharacterized protein n=1 Tax=Trichomalopsis sarcophagae TaxID=543379 RepID=A0A232FHQ3_9HYME|nr:hypothetical protein TSAR_001105 [Trichomalopsis sarcophagae]
MYYQTKSGQIKICLNSKLHENSGKLDHPTFQKRQNRRVQHQLIETLIQNVISNGPAGLLHASILSKLLNRCIRVWSQNVLIEKFGKVDGKPLIDVEFKSRRSSHHLGHWTLKGGKNPVVQPFEAGLGPNDCLYDVVASQTGFTSAELRQRTAIEMYRNQRSIVKLIVARCSDAGDRSFWSFANWMLGGARYSGNSPTDAQRVLNASQYGQCHPEGRQGHPRGHASHPQASGSTESVENYSYSRWRSGFLSRDEQDLVCHYALITSSACDLMARLNNGQFKDDAHIGRHQLDYDPLPKAQIWSGGQPQGSPGDFYTVILVGKHFLNRYNDPSADIFILTFYPKV